MVKTDQLVKDLKGLGFTEYESKAYVSLVKEGIVSAPRLSKASGVPKSKIYDVLKSLADRRMLEEFPGIPRRFKPRAPDFVLDELLMEKEKKIKDMRNCAESLKKKLDGLKDSKEEVLLKKESVIWTVNGRQAFHEKMAEMTESCKEKGFVISPRFSRHPLIDKAIERAKKRGAVFKGITCFDKSNEERIRFYSNYFSEFRNFSGELPLTLVINDENECLYRIEYILNGQMNYVGVHSENPGLVKAFLQYWESLWNASKKIEV